MTALFLRLTSERQRLADQIEELLQPAENDCAASDLTAIRDLSSGPITPSVADRLADLNVYIERDHTDHRRGHSPMLQRLLRDAAGGRVQRLILPTIPTLGRSIREVVSVVCELLDLGLVIIAVLADAEGADPGMTKTLRQVESWHRELDHEKRSAKIKRGQTKARARGKRVGRPKRIFDREEVVRLRDEERRSWPQIAQALHISAGTARRAYRQLAASPGPAKNIREVA